MLTRRGAIIAALVGFTGAAKLGSQTTSIWLQVEIPDKIPDRNWVFMKNRSWDYA